MYPTPITQSKVARLRRRIILARKRKRLDDNESAFFCVSDVNLSTVKTHPPSGDTQSGQNVDPFVDDEVLNGYDDSMLDVDMEDNFIPSSENLDDKHITVEIFDENKRPNLHRAVQNCIVHGPCGPYNKNLPCMKNGSCSKFYPKEFRQRTLIDEAEFPKYRRTDNGRTNCCSSSGDPSKATQVADEIRNYYDCRYISACEAVWRLFGYEIQEKKLFVIRLSFHLEDEKPVVYGETSNVNDIVERAISHKSIFLGWMAANMSYPYARSLIYAEFPTKFVWKDDSSKWFPRKKGFAIGRLTHVHVVNTEEYYQRLLLNTQRECMSFRDIRIVGGTIYATYRDACFALGLLQDDKEFIDAIKEASSWASGSYVRRLFVILLTSNNISRPEHVWDRCWHELSDDILYRQRAVMNMRELTMSDDEIKQLCLMNIDKILHSYGKTLKDYPPMPLATEVDSSLLTERVIREELNFNRDDLKKNASDMLAIVTPEQRYAFNKIVTVVYCDEGVFSLWNTESQLDLYGLELLNSINCSGLPPHKLILKVGVSVMLLRNIDQSSGLCNGTRLQVRKLGNHVIECEVLMGNNVGHIVLIPRMNMVPTNKIVPVRFQRKQFP
ncbi:uncharacterized protein [Arachis hypogaea]|uniref:uncharacterized protein n=1 Tax=Arachis hypogaea TaxID=3818 RepID=UPI003B2251C9